MLKLKAVKDKSQIILRQSRIKVLVWGIGIEYEKVSDLLRKFQDEGDIDVIGITSVHNIKGRFDGYRIIPRTRLKDEEIDCVLNCYYGLIIKDEEKHIKCTCGQNVLIVSSDVIFLHGFSFHKYIALVQSRLSVFPYNCWGGFIYHMFHLQFLSPMINMFVNGDQQCMKLFENLPQYINSDLVFVRTERNTVDYFDYPVFSIGGDVELRMNHYHSADEGREKFIQRRKRINWDNCLLMMITHHHKILEAFHELPYSKKICFVPFHSKIPEAAYINPKLYDRKKHFVWLANSTARGYSPFYDLWELMLNGNVKSRLQE